ncbi:uncharacterized protein V6R79_006712 [Siganus canaliculatus]
MSQKTATTGSRSGENLKHMGQGRNELSLSPLSGAELKVVIQCPKTRTGNIKELLKELNGLYEQRLSYLDKGNDVARGELVMKKVNFLRSYVSDLAEQNQLLVQTIEDLQKGTHDEVSSQGMKLHSSVDSLEGPYVELTPVFLDELTGSAAEKPHSSASSIPTASALENHQIQEQATDTTHLEREKWGGNFLREQKVLESSEWLLHLQSELSCLQQLQKDNVKEITEKDICITKLQATVQLLQQEEDDRRAQLSKLSVRARELQEELEKKEEAWRRREDEQRLRYEKERRDAEERRRRERQRREEEENKREEAWKRMVEEEREAHAEAAEKWAEKAAVSKSQVTEREERVRHLDQEVIGLRAKRDSLTTTLTMKEKHMQQLVQENAQLKESLTTLQSKLSDVGDRLNQFETDLSDEKHQRQQIQDQLHHADKERERLQQELSHVHRATEKKIQRREIKICTLVRDLTESKKQHSERQDELLQRQTALDKLCKRMEELRAKMEDQGRECVHLRQTKDRLEADLALSHEKLRTSHLEVRSRDQLILQLRGEMKTTEQKHHRMHEQMAAMDAEVRHLKHKVRRHQDEAYQRNELVRDFERLKDQKEKEQQELHDQLRISQQQVDALEGKLQKQEDEMELLHQQLKVAKEELKDASLNACGQKETVAIFKQKYTAAIEKVHKVQGQVGLLQEELQYSQQQLRVSQLATHSVKEELAEMTQRYREKVDQWENSQEALEQLTDELQTNQNLLRESQQNVENLKGHMESLQEQVDTLKQQKLVLECDLRLHQQSHSHSDEEYRSLLRHRQQLQKCCSEQVERIAECEKAILQMKSELERQSQEKVGLKKNLIVSHHTHMNNQSQLEQEVLRLKKEVTRLELELADNQKVHVSLLRQSEEELTEARREAARRSGEAAAQRGEVLRLQEELQEKEEKMKSGISEKENLSSHIKQLGQELEELRCKHQVAVEELAARAEEARRMEGRLNEGKLAEGKIRSMAMKLETEVAELKRNLQHSVKHKLKAEQEKQETRKQVDTLRSELEGTRADNANLRHESQLVMTNVNHWIAEQKASSEKLAAQTKAHNKMLLIITEEKEHLQEANDTLKAEVKRLKEVADEKERDAERFKAHIRTQSMWRDERTIERQGCLAVNLSKIEDMQTRLRQNLEAVGMLNQQLNTLSGENKWLRRQLEEERSMRLLLPPPISQQHSSVNLPFNARPPPPSTSLHSSLHLPHPSRLDTGAGDNDGTLAHTKLGRACPERPGESQALGEAFRIRPPASACLEDAWTGRTSRDLTK